MSGSSGGAKEQVARLLRLVPWLHARGGVRLAEAATALDSTPTQVLDDLKVLLMCGLPGGYPDDLIDVDLDALEDEDGTAIKPEGVIRVSNADYLSRPLQLTPSEATALIVALRTLRDGTGPVASTEVVDRVLSKLESALAGADVAARVDVAADAPDPLAGIRSAIDEALGSGRQLEITYYVPARDEESTRVVDPRGLLTSGGLDYLDAFCHSAEAPRTFRLDRIHQVRVLATPAVTEPAEPADLSRRFIEPSPDTEQVTLRLDQRASWVPEYYPVQAVRTLPDGRAEVDLLVGDRRWLQRLLLRLAPSAQVVRPPEFTETFTATAHAALTLYLDSSVEWTSQVQSAPDSRTP